MLNIKYVFNKYKKIHFLKKEIILCLLLINQNY
jgi:hypothetical protein